MGGPPIQSIVVAELKGHIQARPVHERSSISKPAAPIDLVSGIPRRIGYIFASTTQGTATTSTAQRVHEYLALVPRTHIDSRSEDDMLRRIHNGLSVKRPVALAWPT
jgi:hypothetical protein